MILPILNLIASNDSTNAKLALLKTHAENETLKRVYRLAYHPQIQFGIKKIPDFVKTSSDFENTLEGALNFLENTLAKRKVTGNAAITSLASTLSTLSSDDAEVIKRVIGRDLECGASSTMANKVWKDLIPKQPQMLATSYSEKALKEIKFPAYAQLKADGARCFAEIRGFEREDVKLLSRAGNEYQRLDDLKDELIDVYKKVADFYPEGIMIDGELVYTSAPEAMGLDFLLSDNTQTDSVVSRSESNGFANKALKNTITVDEAKRMSFQVWDFVPLSVVYGSEKSATYDFRFLDLKDLTKDSKRLILIENTLVFDLDQAKAIYKSYVEKGLEGIILKNRNSLWENKRSKNLVKFKEEVNIDLRVLDVLAHRKDPNKLGAVVLGTDDGKIKVNCGSGFTDTNQVKESGKWVDIPFEKLDELNRTKLWAERESLIGKLFEIKCNGWITSEGRTDSVSLFLPVILNLRIDKTETSTFEDVFKDSKYPF